MTYTSEKWTDVLYFGNVCQKDFQLLDRDFTRSLVAPDTNRMRQIVSGLQLFLELHVTDLNTSQWH